MIPHVLVTEQSKGNLRHTDPLTHSSAGRERGGSSETNLLWIKRNITVEIGRKTIFLIDRCCSSYLRTRADGCE